MKQVAIIAKGEVQRVGYRDAVEKIGRKLKLTGFVENLKPYDVRIVAEGEEEILNAFVDHVRITDHPTAPISVEELDVEFGAATGEFEYFEIRRGDWHDELGERMDTAGALMYRSLEIGNKMLDKQDQMLDKQDQMLDKQDQMLGKQDRTIEIIEAVREDTDQMLDKQDQMLDKQDQMLGKQDRTIEIIEAVREDTDQIRNALPFLREIRSETTELKNKYEVLSMDVSAIKVKLAV